MGGVYNEHDSASRKGIAGIAELRKKVVAENEIWIKCHTTAGDGGGGLFRGVTGAAINTYTDNNGTIIVPTGGDGSAAWLREYAGSLSVKQFGAVGDGVTDDTIALNNTLAYFKLKYNLSESLASTDTGSILSFVAKNSTYLVTEPLNFTSMRKKGVVLDFTGSTIVSKASGLVVCDYCNSRYVTSLNLHVIGDADQVPSVGVLLACDFTDGDATLNNFEGLNLTGSFSVAAYYNYGAELCKIDRPTIWNYSTVTTSYCVVLTRTNVFKITSSFLVINTVEHSMNEIYFDACDIRKFNNGLCVLIDSVRDMTFKGYMAYGGVFPSPREAHVILETNSTSRTTGLHLICHFEAPYVEAISIVSYRKTPNSNNIQGLEILDMSPQTTYALQVTGVGGAYISGLELKMPFYTAAFGATAFLVQAGLIVRLSGATLINLSTVPDTGVINLNGNIAAFAGTIYTAHANDVTFPLNHAALQANIYTPNRIVHADGRELVNVDANATLNPTRSMIEVRGVVTTGISGACNLINIAEYLDGEEITLFNRTPGLTITLGHNHGVGSMMMKAGVPFSLVSLSIIKFKYVQASGRWFEI